MFQPLQLVKLCHFLEARGNEKRVMFLRGNGGRMVNFHYNHVLKNALNDLESNTLFLLTFAFYFQLLFIHDHVFILNCSNPDFSCTMREVRLLVVLQVNIVASLCYFVTMTKKNATSVTFLVWKK